MGSVLCAARHDHSRQRCTLHAHDRGSALPDDPWGGGAASRHTLVLEGAKPLDPDGRKDIGARRHCLSDLDVEASEFEDCVEQLVRVSVMHAIKHCIPLVFGLVGHSALEVGVAIAH
jgi:hypothetical protein